MEMPLDSRDGTAGTVDVAGDTLLGCLITAPPRAELTADLLTGHTPTTLSEMRLSSHRYKRLRLESPESLMVSFLGDWYQPIGERPWDSARDQMLSIVVGCKPERVNSCPHGRLRGWRWRRMRQRLERRLFQYSHETVPGSDDRWSVEWCRVCHENDQLHIWKNAEPHPPMTI